MNFCNRLFIVGGRNIFISVIKLISFLQNFVSILQKPLELKKHYITNKEKVMINNVMVYSLVLSIYKEFQDDMKLDSVRLKVFLKMKKTK